MAPQTSPAIMVKVPIAWTTAAIVWSFVGHSHRIHQVHLGEAGLGDVPVIGLARNVVLQQRAGFGAPIQPSADRALVGRQQAIDLARADGAHLRFGGGRHREAAAGPRQPRRQQGLQAAGPRIARRDPDRPECPHPRGVIARGSAPTRAPRGPHGWPPPGPNDRLPMVARHRHRLCEHAPLLRPRGPHVPVPHRRQILRPRLWSHAGALLWHTRLGNTL